MPPRAPLRAGAFARAYAPCYTAKVRCDQHCNLQTFLQRKHPGRIIHLSARTSGAHPSKSSVRTKLPDGQSCGFEAIILTSLSSDARSHLFQLP